MDSPLIIDLPHHRYPIHLGHRTLGGAAALIAPALHGGAVLVVTEQRVLDLHGGPLVAGLRAAGVRCEVEVMEGGETGKSLATAAAVWEACARHRIDRTGTLLALGGGVVGDLTGFAAACWMRGIGFVQVPTTLLAMVDAGVGGKTGVNIPAGKNLLGAFKQPDCVVMDLAVLDTLPAREYAAGLAEVVKYGVIREPEFLGWCEANAEALVRRDAAAISHAVRESCRIKAWYVAEDETEQGVRAHLNYGHTFGHALEAETGYDTLLHGEAVAIGMGMAARLAAELGMLEDATLPARQRALLARLGLPVELEVADPAAVIPRLAARCGLDKKAARGKARFILPRRPGVMEMVTDPPAGMVEAAFGSGLRPSDRL